MEAWSAGASPHAILATELKIMSHEVPFPPPRVDDSPTADPNKVPVPEWHMEVLDERLAKYSDGAGGLKTDDWKTWEEIQEDLRKH